MLSEKQCLARNARRQESHKTKRRPHRLGVVSAEGRNVTDEMASISLSPPVCHSPLQQLNSEHRDLISHIVTYQDKFDLPTEEDIQKVSVCLILLVALTCNEVQVSK